MKFAYYNGPQRTPEWYALRIGKVTASRLEDWLSVSQAEKTKGQPLAKRTGYERELQYERQFGVAYNNYVSDAMLDGMELEDWARHQYEIISDNKTDLVGAWYNDIFVASPDSTVGEDGLLEIKIVRDNTFSQILLGSAKDTHAYPNLGELDKKGDPIMVGSGVVEKHWKQIQGQLWASGKKWCDYVAVNLNTKKIKVIRVLPDTQFHEWLELAVPEPIQVEVFSEENLYDVSGEIPQGINVEDNNGEQPKGTPKW